MSISCFKAYDIRGKVPEQLSEALAYDIARAFASELNPRTVVVGYDIRLESPSIAQSVRQGLLDSGVNVVNLGLCGTEEVYFATTHLVADGGIMVTASHNPKGYNGLKLVREHSKPISGDTGLKAIEERVETNDFVESDQAGVETLNTDKSAYIEHLLSYVNPTTWPSFKVVFNSGNGSAGNVIEEIVQHLPITPVYVHLEPNGDFPNGVPNPLLEENRDSTINAVVSSQADIGVAWDGDFDRCFFFDQQGNFIEGYYVVGLLAAALLESNPGAKIIHDPRLTWNTIDIVEKAGGQAVVSKTGHAFIKERMRLEDAVYGGEMSAHHYFKDFFYCDSGMIPWLLVLELMSKTGKSLADLVNERIQAFPCSGEINFRVDDIPSTIERVRAVFAGENPDISTVDGLSMSFTDWRMNIRASNTEPLMRVNIETIGDVGLVDAKLNVVRSLIK